MILRNPIDPAVCQPVVDGRIRRAPLHAMVVTGIGVSATLAIVSTSLAQQAEGPIPAEQTAAAAADPDWSVPQFSWGDPNLEGTFTSRDMSGIPMSRPSSSARAST